MKKILVAVSGGPDSMALLHKLHQEHYEIVVAHVNYKMRSTADRDQKIVEDFCKNHNIKFEYLEKDKEVKGNFQAFAREMRYDFMNDLGHKYNIQELYVAHHCDDHLETYLMQEERGITPSYFGISNTSVYKDLKIIRPLLKYSKEELIYYCKQNDIEFGIDESNESNVYERNRIRNTELSVMCIREKKDLLSKIDSLNEALIDRKNQTLKALSEFKENYKIEYILDNNLENSIDVLREWFTEYDIYNISNEEFENIIAFIDAEGNKDYQITNDYVLNKSYGILKVIRDDDVEYSYSINSPDSFKTAFFEICYSGKPEEGVTLSEDDYPLTIRGYKRGDKIQMVYGTKNVSRFFIDRKIPSYKRKLWPIVLNASKEVILVPGLGCNVTHFSNNPTLFVVK